jgi:serine/threonine protein kinase
VICDFGSATNEKREKMNFKYSTVAVTMRYVAPEYFFPEERTQSTAAFDIWSLGCILTEILTGTHFVFPNPTEVDYAKKWTKKETFLQVLQTSLGFDPKQFTIVPSKIQKQFESRLSKKGVDLILRLLEPNPSKRISIQDALEHPWFFS